MHWLNHCLKAVTANICYNYPDTKRRINLKLLETTISGCFLIEPEVFHDLRGDFFESYNKIEFEKALGKEVNFVQDNHSVSELGVLRGLHFQSGEHAQAKLLNVAHGEILDVVVDIRKNSPTYRQVFTTRISSDNKKMLFIPRGMAHGFLALKPNTVLVYKCDNYYNKEAEGGIIYNDPELNINWEYPTDKMIISKKDQNWGGLETLDL